jgi:glucose-6-phosphate 1-dehydrogenase
MNDAVTFVVFGATGHLSRTKLLPALARVVDSAGIANHAIIGVGSRPRTDIEFRELAASAMDADLVSSDASAQFLAGEFAYASVSDTASYTTLASLVAETEQRRDLPGNRVLYLAVPPSKLDATIEGINASGLGEGKGWTRLVVEKPFGVDLETAVASNDVIHRCFAEDQVYRIDHFLGKETVRNLLVFRFTNSLFEQTWNRRHIESVEITVAESTGLDGRAAYFDESGTVRDMVQNHLTQILTLIAMEPPVQMDARSIHVEKTKVLNAIRPLSADDAVLGRYGPGTIDGETVAGYLDEPDVPSGSVTPTYAAIRLHIDNWRWQGVPFYLRTGKRMSQRTSEVVVRYLRPPVCLFHTDGTCDGHQNSLSLRLQPEEGFKLMFDVKQPGPDTAIGQIPLAVRYDDLLESAPEAYETLLADVVEGDQTLFVHAEEVEEAWRIYEPLLDRSDIHTYPAGSDGPERAEGLIVTHPGSWSAI